jgi:hypothetical protein
MKSKTEKVILQQKDAPTKDPEKIFLKDIYRPCRSIDITGNFYIASYEIPRTEI